MEISSCMPAQPQGTGPITTNSHIVVREILAPFYPQFLETKGKLIAFKVQLMVWQEGGFTYHLILYFFTLKLTLDHFAEIKLLRTKKNVTADMIRTNVMKNVVILMMLLRI